MLVSLYPVASKFTRIRQSSSFQYSKASELSLAVAVQVVFSSSHAMQGALSKFPQFDQVQQAASLPFAHPNHSSVTDSDRNLRDNTRSPSNKGISAAERYA
jgi:hypothetical protein